ncbi:MAG: MmgE/PrpD family protein [Stomatobaculum sp.]|nr:MmgE/PrpD family protein [Stomatobaculum sp.]
MSITERTAQAILDFKYEQIPPRGAAQSKAAVIDSLGVSFYGPEEPFVKALRQVTLAGGSIPEATIWSTGEKTSLLNAALLNSAELHCIDYDNGGSLGHPASVLMAAALGIGEKCAVSGHKVIESYAAAYELGARMRESMGNLQFGAGYHATSLLGVICCAAESAKLLGYNTQKTKMAMSLATGMSSGMMQSFGTDTKPLQVAKASQNGVLAALLAGEGCVGDPEIFEESKGFYYVYGQDGASMDALLMDFGNPVKVASERGHFKQWACCGGNYEVLSALYNYGKRIDPEEIEHITIRLSMDPPGPAFRVHPRTTEECRFSVTYNTASCIVDGIVDLSTFTEEKFRRPAVQSLVEKSTVVKFGKDDVRPEKIRDEKRFVVIDILKKDGSVLSISQGASDRLQLEDEQIYEKFAVNAARAGIPDRNIQRTVKLVKDLENVSDIGDVIRSLRD